MYIQDYKLYILMFQNNFLTLFNTVIKKLKQVSDSCAPCNQSDLGFLEFLELNLIHVIGSWLNYYCSQNSLRWTELISWIPEFVITLPVVHSSATLHAVVLSVMNTAWALSVIFNRISQIYCFNRRFYTLRLNSSANENVHTSN